MADPPGWRRPDPANIAAAEQFHPRRDPAGAVLVECDEEACPAVYDPDPADPAAVTAAYVHWRFHDYLGGCSHGC